MKYYAGHENTYRRLEAEGESCWDRTAFDAFFMRPFLELALARLDMPAGARALDLGCGTGPVALFLAARGFEVTGVDLSPTALRIANRIAAERNLSARFELGDVLALECPEPFDLVVDSHLLHCIIYDEDRQRLFTTIRGLMKPGGAFVVETMARHAAVQFGDAFLLDDAGVLWRNYADGDPADTKLVDGKPYHPNRRILTPEALAAELDGAGFVVEWSRTQHEEHPGEPRNFQAILRKR